MPPSLTAPDTDARPVDTAGVPLGRRLAVPVGLFLASRVVALCAAWTATILNPKLTLGDVLGKWDGGWYIDIATRGYPSVVSNAHGVAGQSSVAFFPVYPLLIRAVVKVTPFGPRTAGVLVNLAAAAAAAVVLWLLAEALCGPRAASRAVALFVFYPGAFVFSMVYSEGVFILCAAACLYFLVKHTWAAAGVAGAVAGAARPSGLVVIACCGVAAAVALRRERDWRSLAAPLLGVSGFVAYLIYLQRHTGSAMSWERAQANGWDQGFDGGAHTLSRFGDFVKHPLGEFNLTVSALAFLVVVAVAVLWAVSRWRPPAVVFVYTAGILAPAFLSSVLTSTARFTMTAFPLFFILGKRVKGDAFHALLGLSAGCMAILMIVAGATFGYTP